MSRTTSKAVKEGVARVRAVFTELEKYINRLPHCARMTCGDLSHEFAAKFNLHEPHVRALISFYFRTKYDLGEQDVFITRGYGGGIRKIRK